MVSLVEADKQHKHTKKITKKKIRSSNRHLILSTKRKKIAKNVYTPVFHVTNKEKKIISTRNKQTVKKRLVLVGGDKENNDERDNDLTQLRKLVSSNNITNHRGNLPLPPVSLINNNLPRPQRKSPESIRSTSPFDSRYVNPSPRQQNSPQNSQSPTPVDLINNSSPLPQHNSPQNSRSPTPVNSILKSNSSFHSSKNDDGPFSETILDDDEQLLGQDFQGDTMIELMDSIYCTKSVIEEIFVRPRTSTAVARYLMEGVFNPANLLNCTLTGRKIQNQGKDQQNKYTKSLNYTARETIKEFAKSYAISKNLTPQDNMAYDRAMTIKLGEMKRDYVDQLQRQQQSVNMTDELGKIKRACRARLAHQQQDERVI